MEKRLPRVAVGVCIFRAGKVLLGPRKGALAVGKYGFPGGNLEHGETLVQCAARETFEETGMQISHIRVLLITDHLTYMPEHFLEMGMIADWAEGEPLLCEPEKCGGWDWYDPKNLPQPLFPTIPSYFEAHRTGRIYFGAIR